MQFKKPWKEERERERESVFSQASHVGNPPQTELSSGSVFHAAMVKEGILFLEEDGTA